MKRYLTFLFALTASSTLHAQLPPPTEDVAHAFKKEKNYSPYAGRNFPTDVYWGDTHVHTGMSMDAGANGVENSP